MKGPNGEPANNLENRGLKRGHSEIANCDCDDVPLSKRINRLNIDQPSRHLHASHQTRPGTSNCQNGMNPCGFSGNSHPGPPQPNNGPTQFEDSNSSFSDQQKSFEESYPYSANSEYFSSNHLLYHLHNERVHRQIQRTHDPRSNINVQHHFQS